MVLEQFIIDADIIWDQVGKTFFENPEAKPGRIMRVQVVNAGIIEDLTGYTLNLGWTSVRDPSKFGLDAFDDVDITKGIFEIEYTSGMLTNIGPLNASLQLVPPGVGRPIESNNFKLTVKNSAINPEAIQGEASFSTLENALVEVNGWNARIDVVEQEFKDRADALDGAYPVRLADVEQSVAAVEAQVDLLNRGLGETMPTMASLLSTYPTGDTRDHIVAGNIAEVDTLTVTGIPTTAGNVTVTLNGVAVNVPVTIGVAEVASLVVSAVPIVAGNVTVNLNGTAVTVAVDPAVETIMDLVAAKIRATVFTGWTTGGTGSTVTFTATAVGTKTDATYSAGTTGATGTMTTTTQGVAAATTTTVATAIRLASYSGWITGGTGAVVTFTATTVGTRTAPVFSGGATGTIGTFVRTAIGEAANFHRYFWNDTAWADGGLHQIAVGLAGTTGRRVNEVMTQQAVTDELGIGTSVPGFVGVNGNSENGTNVDGRTRTEYIRIPKGKSITYLGENNNQYVSVLAFYDKNKFFISGISNNGPTMEVRTVPAESVPTNAAYIRLGAHKSQAETAFVQFGSVQSVIQEVENSLTDAINLVSLDVDSRIPKTPGKNLFNMDTVTHDYYFNQIGGLVPLSTHYVSDFIRVMPLASYKLTNLNPGGGYIMFYDEQMTVVGSIQGNTLGANPLVIPANAYYTRVSSQNAELIASAQMELGTVATEYESFSIFGPDIGNLRRDVTIGLANKIDVKIGKNLFNKDANENFLLGKYMGQYGSLADNPLYYVSDYILVEPNTAYANSNFSMGGAYSCIYNENKQFISSFKDAVITTPTNGYYLRMSGVISGLNSQQVEKGSAVTNYTAWTEYAPLEAVSASIRSEEVVTILPSKMYFAKDKQATIYYENVLLKNYDEPINLFFDKGTNYNRQVAFKFTAAASNQSMTAQCIGNFKRGNLKTINYDVIDPAVNNGKTLDMLFIGDSFTDIGSHVTETKALLGAAGATANLIGTCGNGSTFKAEGLSGGNLLNTFLNSSAGVARKIQVTGVTQIPSTGYPGQTYRDETGKDWTIRGGVLDGSGNGYLVVTKYGAVEADFATFPSIGVLTKITAGIGSATINYTNPIPAYHNPFINPSTGLLDFSNYITSWGFNVPEIVVFQFTWNDTSTWASSSTTLVANFKVAIDHIHAAYPNTKIILSIEPFGSVNGNKDWNGKKYTVLKLMTELLAVFESDVTYNTWVKIAPSYAFVDLVYGYSTSTVTPSERYAVTEQSGGDGVHPTTAGMYQIADCIYPVAQHLLSII